MSTNYLGRIQGDASHGASPFLLFPSDEVILQRHNVAAEGLVTHRCDEASGALHLAFESFLDSDISAFDSLSFTTPTTYYWLHAL